jgi:shikimate kinase
VIRDAPTPEVGRPSDVGSIVGRSGPRRVVDDVPRHVHVLLLGLMGSGKSSVGILVANELGRPFVDSDDIVPLRTGRSTVHLAECDGAERLHDAELKAAHRVLAGRDAVVFAGGAGIVERLAPGDLGRAWAVWLATEPEELATRLAGASARALLGPAPLDVSRRQHRRRTPIARQLADAIVSTDGRTPREAAAEVRDARAAHARSPR